MRFGNAKEICKDCTKCFGGFRKYETFGRYIQKIRTYFVLNAENGAGDECRLTGKPKGNILKGTKHYETFFFLRCNEERKLVEFRNGGLFLWAISLDQLF